MELKTSHAVLLNCKYKFRQVGVVKVVSGDKTNRPKTGSESECDSCVLINQLFTVYCLVLSLRLRLRYTKAKQREA